MKLPNLHTFKISILFSLLLFCSSTAHAVDITHLSDYKFITIQYVSVDNENNPVVLSEGIFYPTKNIFNTSPAKVKFVVLNNHGTICDNQQAPTGDSPLDGSTVCPHGSMGLMTTERALVICPDYLGYGVSKNQVHPYCNHTLTAKNVLDGYVAAIDSVKALGIEFEDDYYTLIAGYSQGGAVTMAVQKYLETEASQDIVDLVRLKHSYCGAGPYDLPLTYKDLAGRETLAYACSLPMTIEGLKAAYNEGCMKQVDLDSIYISKDFHLYMEKLINAKEYTSEMIDDSIAAYFKKESVSAQDFIRPEILNHTSNAALCIDKALAKCNMLDGSWMPQTPITMFQFTGDDVVPFVNSEEAVNLFGDKLKLYTEKSGIECSDWWMKLMLQTTMPNPKCHLDYGTVFYIYFIDGVLRDL